MPPAPEVVRYDPDLWPRLAAGRIQDELDWAGRRESRRSVLLTGGRSAARLYTAWAAIPEFRNLEAVDFYFGDERWVPSDSPESNYGLAMRTLFRDGVPGGCTVRPMNSDAADRDAAAVRYEELLPGVIDLLLLGVGEDGHIASLFPYSAGLKEARRKVVPATGPEPPRDRLTITPPVIASARRVFVLAPGAAKAKVLTEVLVDGLTYWEQPVRLADHAVWLTDSYPPDGSTPRDRMTVCRES